MTTIGVAGIVAAIPAPVHRREDALMSTATATVPFLVAGRFETSASDRRGDVFNPSTGRVQAQVPFCTPEEIDRVVRSAADALPAWSETPAVDRARVLFRFRELMAARVEELAALVTREHG